MLYERCRIVDGVPKFSHEICVVIVSAGILLSQIVHIFIKVSRKCVNNPNAFYYICGEVTFASRKCLITPAKKGHISYISAVS